MVFTSAQHRIDFWSAERARLRQLLEFDRLPVREQIEAEIKAIDELLRLAREEMERAQPPGTSPCDHKKPATTDNNDAQGAADPVSSR